jgi:hypothetical protein
MRVLHHNVCRTPLGKANAFLPAASSCAMGRLLTGLDGARGERMTALPHSTASANERSTKNARWLSTTNLLALTLAALLLIAPETANALAGGPAPQPPPPLPEDDAGGDDLFLLQTAVSPNVILFMDNSDSMNQIEWHPAFDPDKVPDATYCTLSADITEFAGVLDSTHTYVDNQDRNNVNCDFPARADRTVYFVQHPLDTLWSGRYLMWYLGLDEVADAAILLEIDTAVADVDGCTQSGGAAAFANTYRRTRFEATKQVLLDLLCVAEPKNVRFGSAAFREAEDVGGVDPNGGYITSDLGRTNPNHAAELESSISNENPVLTDGTPLAETLFQIYTYWMPRVAADMPLGRNGNPFPIYEYNKFGVQVGSVGWFEDAMLYDCEKAIEIIVTDGAPTRDTFELVNVSDPTSTALGFSDYGVGGATGLIGDYHIESGIAPDLIDVEEPGGVDEISYYLDDISKYMYDKDFRPDLAGDQTIDTYVVAFSTGDVNNATNTYLKKVAANGNGTFYTAKTGDELIAKLVEALNDIIEKAASFTAATVPSARTADGADFYQSYFFPRGKSAFWEGHIRSWTISATGKILDKNDACALDDPGGALECNSGPFLPAAVYHWDAAEEVPLPAARKLYVSKGLANCGTDVLATGSLPPSFDQTEMCAAELGLVDFTVPSDPDPNDPGYLVNGSTSINKEGLSDEVVEFVRGCFFATGVNPSTDVNTPVDCLERPARLGDIFHSNAIAIRQPDLKITDPGYSDFKGNYAGRSRLLYAGSNGGFLEAFDTGEWVAEVAGPPIIPAHYDRGTGAEVFGFMPWEVRQNIRKIIVDDPTNRSNYVDGDVNSADVWIDANGDNVGTGGEWHTYLLGALREGGHHYYAVDVTNPPDTTHPAGRDIFGSLGTKLDFPGYLWEFPAEGNATDLAFMGETWSKPIITKVKLNVFGSLTGETVERWVAIVTGGYDGASDPNPLEVTGSASAYDAALGLKGRGIYIIDLKTGGVLAEQKFDPAIAPALAGANHQAAMLFSVVSTTSVLDLNFDGVADVIYVGDMGGNVWKWAIHNAGEDTVTEGLGSRSQANWRFKKFFAAAPATIGTVTYYKNIMYPPAAAYKNGALYIAFGSGERRNLNFGGDVADTTENNRFYVMLDSDPYESQALTAAIVETDLTDFSGSAAPQTFVNKGFYFEVADGEKFVTNIEIFNGEVIAATFKPTVSVDPCATRGEGTLYVFDLQNGGGHFDDGAGGAERGLSLGPGLPTDPKVSIGPGGKDTKIIIEKSGSDIDIIDEDPPALGGATLFWREND